MKTQFQINILPEIFTDLYTPYGLLIQTKCVSVSYSFHNSGIILIICLYKWILKMKYIREFLSLFFIYKDIDYSEYLNKDSVAERMRDCFSKTGQSFFKALDI